MQCPVSLLQLLHDSKNSSNFALDKQTGNQMRQLNIKTVLILAAALLLIGSLFYSCNEHKPSAPGLPYYPDDSYTHPGMSADPEQDTMMVFSSDDKKRFFLDTITPPINPLIPYGHYAVKGVLYSYVLSVNHYRPGLQTIQSGMSYLLTNKKKLITFGFPMLQNFYLGDTIGVLGVPGRMIYKDSYIYGLDIDSVWLISPYQYRQVKE